MIHSQDLVGGIPTPLNNMSSSVGMMKFPIYGKLQNVPNHQPVFIVELPNTHLSSIFLGITDYAQLWGKKKRLLGLLATLL